MELSPKFSYDIRSGTTNLEDAITSIDVTVIANNLDDVIEWCKGDYITGNMEEINSDEHYVFYEYSYYGKVSDHGNVIEVNSDGYLDEVTGEVLPEFEDEIGEWRDTCEINGGEISNEDYKYMISGQYHNRIIDLTESE